MSKEIPCPRCCKHTVIENHDWIAGGIVTCKVCGYRMKISPHASSSLTPDEVMLKKTQPKRKRPRLSAEEMDALEPKRPDIVQKVVGGCTNRNPRPYVDIKKQGKTGHSVEVGLKFSF